MVSAAGCSHTLRPDTTPQAEPVQGYDHHWKSEFIWTAVDASSRIPLEQVCPQGWSEIDTAPSILNIVPWFLTVGIYSPRSVTVHCAVAAPPRHLAVTGAATALERVTSEPVDEDHPTLSSDGTTLLFASRVTNPGGAITQQTLVAVNPNLRGQRSLYTAANSRSDFPVWLPDQSSYIYASNSPGEWSLVKALTATSNSAINVIASGEIAPSPKWPAVSPDAKTVAFVANMRGTPTLATIGIDGSRLALLGEGNEPAWSPDGKQIAFARKVGSFSQLFLLDPGTGANLVQLTSGDFNANEPAWSPDSRFIVFKTDRGTAASVHNLYIVRRDGTELTQLTDGNAQSVTPTWGRDGWIYFASDQAGTFDIWRLRVGVSFAVATPAGQPAPAATLPSASAAPAKSEPVSPTAPSAVGCTRDVDCKGDRICDNHQCVDPADKKRHK